MREGKEEDMTEGYKKIGCKGAQGCGGRRCETGRGN